MVAEWSEPVELRPCPALVVHPAQLVKNGKLSLEDTTEDTLDALKQGEYNAEDDEDDTFMSLDTDESPSMPTWEQWVDALEEMGESAVPSSGAVDKASSSKTATR